MKLTTILLIFTLLTTILGGCEKTTKDTFPRGVKVPVIHSFDYQQTNKLTGETTTKTFNLGGSTVELTTENFIFCQPWGNNHVQVYGEMPDPRDDANNSEGYKDNDITCSDYTIKEWSGNRFLGKMLFYPNLAQIVCEIELSEITCLSIHPDAPEGAYAHPENFPGAIIDKDIYDGTVVK
jgi:hypothetical protein